MLRPVSKHAELSDAIVMACLEIDTWIFNRLWHPPPA